MLSNFCMYFVLLTTNSIIFYFYTFQNTARRKGATAPISYLPAIKKWKHLDPIQNIPKILPRSEINILPQNLRLSVLKGPIKNVIQIMSPYMDLNVLKMLLQLPDGINLLSQSLCQSPSAA